MITVYDTAVGSLNLGDHIIMDAVTHELNSMFPSEQKTHYPTHYALARSTLKQAWSNPLGFVGGTNLLRNYWRYRARKNQWALRFLDAFVMQPAVLMGAGWNVYADNPEFKAKVFYKRALSERWVHSVRDTYTVDQLKKCGVNNAVNTGCPTLWQLDSKRLEQLSLHRRSNVVFTLTDYRVDQEADVTLIQTLLKSYETVFFWPQGSKDMDYFKQLCAQGSISPDSIRCLSADLESYNNLLDQFDIDFVGTRLHAGIRALQRGQRALILGVDNRALEMQKDFNIPVLDRAHIAQLKTTLDSPEPIRIHLPHEVINSWKAQFFQA